MCLETASDWEIARAHRMGSDEHAVIWHEPVMVEEVLRLLDPRPGQVIVDATVGTGGHSLALLPRVLPDGRVIAMDRDARALAMAEQRLVEFRPQVIFARANYRNLPEVLRGIATPRVDGLLLDLGVSSRQLDTAERGLSFLAEGPLDMRMDLEQPLTAQTIINDWSSMELATILERFGEERYARRISEAIVHTRARQPFLTTTQLAHCVVRALPFRARHGRLHAATRTFQALRIAVNDELGALETLLQHLHECLNAQARVVVLTFHSLEDRLVKRTFQDGAREGRWTLLVKKPLVPTAHEVERNPRARSAKLRALEVRP